MIAEDILFSSYCKTIASNCLPPLPVDRSDTVVHGNLKTHQAIVS
jgi:hypothetical protein